MRLDSLGYDAMRIGLTLLSPPAGTAGKEDEIRSLAPSGSLAALVPTPQLAGLPRCPGAHAQGAGAKPSTIRVREVGERALISASDVQRQRAIQVSASGEVAGRTVTWTRSPFGFAGPRDVPPPPAGTYRLVSVAAQGGVGDEVRLEDGSAFRNPGCRFDTSKQTQADWLESAMRI